MDFLKRIKLKDNTRKLSKTDWMLMGIMVLLYGILSFIRLGDTSVPITYKTFDYAHDEVVVTLQNEESIANMRYYTGNNLGEIKVLSSLNGINYDDVTSFKIESVFTWQDLTLNTHAKYIKFVAEKDKSTLGDVVFYDMYKNRIPVINDNPLVDEINLVPDEISYMNSTYFDEIYYARTVYEYLHGISGYEWTHPPLGKIIMTIPVAIFGFSPFAYRLMGNLFGILMIPIMYILAKRIFKNRKWAILAGLIMMLDNFHFVHTRIALIDGFQVVFILLSVLFMKEYMDTGKKTDFRKKAIYLLLSGIFIGCAIATKWNALYAGLGLAIIYFVHLFREYNVNVVKYIKNKVTISKAVDWFVILALIPFALYYLMFILVGKNFGGISLIVYYFVIGSLLLVRFSVFISKDKYLVKLMIISIISFIIIPVVIYGLSFLLSPAIDNYDGTIKGIININELMYNYHANLVATHPFSSPWYKWPIMAKPVWLYTGSTSSGLHMTITDIGNPSVWWAGIISFGYLIVSAIKKKDKNSIFLLIFILSTFIPYIFVGRLMFMYHYFITLPFVMLGIVSFIKWLTDKTKSNKIYYVYIILIFITFMVFYPVVSGMPVESDYIDSLKWLSGWYF